MWKLTTGLPALLDGFTVQRDPLRPGIPRQARKVSLARGRGLVYETGLVALSENISGSFTDRLRAPSRGPPKGASGVRPSGIWLDLPHPWHAASASRSRGAADDSVRDRREVGDGATARRRPACCAFLVSPGKPTPRSTRPTRPSEN